jgi:hypothetical protein
MGATCYQNVMLQSLFHIPLFRRLIYNMDTTIETPPGENVPLQLQRLFAEMQLHPSRPCSTHSFTAAFGLDSHSQQDTEEFCRKLLDSIETQMAGTPLADTVKGLFAAEIRATITRPPPSIASVATEFCYGLALDVAGFDSLAASLDHFLERVTLDGEGVDGFIERAFVRLPPVLHLHLKRFTFDPSTNSPMKITTRFSFPPLLPVPRWLAGSTDYELVGVLVHSGPADRGHYYAYLRAGPDLTWYKFDDSAVTTATPEEAIDGNFGAPDSADCEWSAYCLVYADRSDMGRLFPAVDDTAIPPEVADSPAIPDGNAEQRAPEEPSAMRLVFLETIEQNARLSQVSVRPHQSMPPNFPFHPDWTADRLYTQAELMIGARNFILYPIRSDELGPALFPSSASLGMLHQLCNGFLVAPLASVWSWDGGVIAECTEMLLVIAMAYVSSLAIPLHFAFLRHVRTSDRVETLFPEFRHQFGIDDSRTILAFGVGSEDAFQLRPERQFGVKAPAMTVILQPEDVKHYPDGLSFLDTEDAPPDTSRGSARGAIFCADPSWPPIFLAFYRFRWNTFPVQVTCLASGASQLFAVPRELPGRAFLAFVARHFCQGYSPITHSVISFLCDNKRQIVFGDKTASATLGVGQDDLDTLDLKVAVYNAVADPLLADLVLLKVANASAPETRELTLFQGCLTIGDLIQQFVGDSDLTNWQMAAITGDGPGEILSPWTRIEDEAVSGSLWLEGIRTDA